MFKGLKTLDSLFPLRLSEDFATRLRALFIKITQPVWEVGPSSAVCLPLSRCGREHRLTFLRVLPYVDFVFSEHFKFAVSSDSTKIGGALGSTFPSSYPLGRPSTLWITWGHLKSHSLPLADPYIPETLPFMSNHYMLREWNS